MLNVEAISIAFYCTVALQRWSSMKMQERNFHVELIKREDFLCALLENNLTLHIEENTLVIE